MSKRQHITGVIKFISYGTEDNEMRATRKSIEDFLEDEYAVREDQTVHTPLPKGSKGKLEFDVNMRLAGTKVEGFIFFYGDLRDVGNFNDFENWLLNKFDELEVFEKSTKTAIRGLSFEVECFYEIRVYFRKADRHGKRCVSKAGYLKWL